ncbi:hypothetical protein EsH8_II_000637 [Colletotrichum jinshuiense]
MLLNDKLKGVGMDSGKPARFLILPFYQAQVDEYRRMLREDHADLGISSTDLRRIEVLALGSSQGKESDCVFVDYVQTDSLGFCDDPNIDFFATTRSKQCEIIIANQGMIASAKTTKLHAILKDAQANGYFVQIPSCGICCQHDHTDQQCKQAKKRCDYCGEGGHTPFARSAGGLTQASHAKCANIA